MLFKETHLIRFKKFSSLTRQTWIKMYVFGQSHGLGHARVDEMSVRFALLVLHCVPHCFFHPEIWSFSFCGIVAKVSNIVYDACGILCKSLRFCWRICIKLLRTLPQKFSANTANTAENNANLSGYNENFCIILKSLAEDTKVFCGQYHNTLWTILLWNL